MIEYPITDLIEKAQQILKDEVRLAEKSLKVSISRAFKPISDFYVCKETTIYSEGLMKELEHIYEDKFRTGAMSRNVFNVRTRGIRILREVYQTDTFVWKGPAKIGNETLQGSFEFPITGTVNSLVCSASRRRMVLSILRRFCQFLSSQGIHEFPQITSEHVRVFLNDISTSRPKSMDDVIDALRKLDQYLINLGNTGLPYAGLLMAPRARDKKIYPCMPQDELNTVLEHIDRSTAVGKRDFAILILAASTGLRTGDIANIQLKDIDWLQNEIHLIQGKNQKPIHLPLYRSVGTAIADYILNGRPASESSQIFLRSLAPFQNFKDGVSVACILRRRLKEAGITHELGDGKTMHGIRRMLGTRMTIEGVPITTVAQILGHKNISVTRQYISLDIEGLRECALGFDSISEVKPGC